ncbi:hypothetical protein D1Y84_13260 [Acidipila sp. EB88]|nr:hypothetical protein D1Y84_13260 [Acidipila sp. EB88]
MNTNYTKRNSVEHVPAEFCLGIVLIKMLRKPEYVIQRSLAAVLTRCTLLYSGDWQPDTQCRLGDALVTKA